MVGAAAEFDEHLGQLGGRTFDSSRFPKWRFEFRPWESIPEVQASKDMIPLHDGQVLCIVRPRADSS